MTVSKHRSRRTCAAAPSSDLEQAQSRAVSPLRQRMMIGDMELAGLSLSTQQCYLRAVVALQRHTDTRPPTGSPRSRCTSNVLWLRDTKGVTKGTFQPHWHGIKFFYYRTLGVDWPLFTPRVRPPQRCRLPQAIAWDDGRRLIARIRKPGYRLCCSFMLGLGLRISDTLNLTVQAIDSKNMIVRVIGKGNKERILPPTLLRAYWPGHGNPHLLFPNRKGDKSSLLREIAAPCLQRRPRPPRYQQPYHATQHEERICHPPFGARRRHPRRADVPRPRQPRID